MSITVKSKIELRGGRAWNRGKMKNIERLLSSFYILGTKEMENLRGSHIVGQFIKADNERPKNNPGKGDLEEKVVKSSYIFTCLSGNET